MKFEFGKNEFNIPRCKSDLRLYLATRQSHASVALSGFVLVVRVMWSEPISHITRDAAVTQMLCQNKKKRKDRDEQNTVRFTYNPFMLQTKLYIKFTEFTETIIINATDTDSISRHRHLPYIVFYLIYTVSQKKNILLYFCL